MQSGAHGGAPQATKPGPREAHGSVDPQIEEWWSAVRWNGGSPVRLCGGAVALFLAKTMAQGGKGYRLRPFYRWRGMEVAWKECQGSNRSYLVKWCGARGSVAGGVHVLMVRRGHCRRHTVLAPV
jgi:hypothetical protein